MPIPKANCMQWEHWKSPNSSTVTREIFGVDCSLVEAVLALSWAGGRRLFLNDSRERPESDSEFGTDGSEHNDRDGHGDESTASDKQIEQSC